MQLKYVGDVPLISKNGVGFDHTQPDKFMYLHAVTELLEALSYGPTQTTEHLYNAKDGKISSEELLRKLKKHVKNLDNAFEVRDKKAHDYVHDLVTRVRENDALTKDEQTAWLENIKLMRAYFYQYITNGAAYDEAIKALSDEVHDAKIQEIKVPLFKNYGIVINDLSEALERRRQAIDSELIIEDKDGEIIATLKITHH